MPHIKSYAKLESNGAIAWVLLTSANLSKAAWGALEVCLGAIMHDLTISEEQHAALYQIVRAWCALRGHTGPQLCRLINRRTGCTPGPCPGWLRLRAQRCSAGATAVRHAVDSLHPTRWPGDMSLSVCPSVCLSLSATHSLSHSHTLSLSHTHSLSASVHHQLIVMQMRCGCVIKTTPSWTATDASGAVGSQLIQLDLSDVFRINKYLLGRCYACMHKFMIRVSRRVLEYAQEPHR